MVVRIYLSFSDFPEINLRVKNKLVRTVTDTEPDIT